MVPIYSIACTLSIEFYEDNVYIASVYEFYESLVIAAFFLLLCQYLHTDLETLQQVFTLVEPKPWLHPVRFFATRIGRNKKGQGPDGLRWFSIIWACVFQFCAVKFLGALIKCITEAAGVYCEESNDPSHAKIWVMIIEILSLVTAMFCLLQFYHQTKVVLQPHRPLLKFVAIKLVIFLFYVQSFIFNMLTKEGGAIKPSAKISYPSWAVGIPNTLLCIEMAAVSILHLWAYPYHGYQYGFSAGKAVDTDQSPFDDQRPFSTVFTMRNQQLPLEMETFRGASHDGITRPQPIVLVSQGGALGWRALVDALNFSDIVRSVMKAFHWLFVQRRSSRSASVSDLMQGSGSTGIGSMERPRTSDLAEALAAIH